MAKRKGKAGDAPTGEQPEADASSVLVEDLVEETPVAVEETPGDTGTEVPLTEQPSEAETPGAKPRGEGEKKGDVTVALREERERRRAAEARANQLLADVERERGARQQEEERRRTAEQEAARNKRLEKLGESGDPVEIGTIVRDMVLEEVTQHRVEDRMSILELSQKQARRDYKDYDERLQKSGVQAAITWDAVNGRPGDKVIYDKIIVRSKDPAEEAYALATAILKQRGELKEEPGDDTPAKPPTTSVDDVVLDDTPGDRSSGRREVLTRISSNAGRPQSIRELRPAAPASTNGSTRGALTVADIDKMSEEEYAALPERTRKRYMELKG